MTLTGRDLLEGVTVPVVTTMGADRSPDAQQMHAVLDALAAAGITRIMAFGSNGEGPVLGDGEIARFARSVALQWRKRAPSGSLTVNVSGSSTTDSLRRAEAVRESEPDALLLSPPMYFRHSRAEIVAHFRAFADVEIPVVAYNSPAYTGNDLLPEIVAEIAAMDHVVGIKDSSRAEGRIAELIAIRDARPGFGVSQGDELGIATALAAGADGFTPGIGNLAPRLTVRLFEAWAKGDAPAVDAMQETIAQLVRIHEIRPGVATVKMALNLRGLCEPHASLPFAPFEASDRERLAVFLADWDAELVGRA